MLNLILFSMKLRQVMSSGLLCFESEVILACFAGK